MLRAVLRRLAANAVDPILASHRLKGELDGYWACTVDRDLRLLFRWHEEERFLVNVGSHDQVC